MKIIDDFKNFAVRGNVLDLAVAVVVGGAFGKIVSSFVNDILMPPIGLLLGQVDFKELKLVLRQGTASNVEVSINYGNFIQNIVDFLIVSAAVFAVVQFSNKIVNKKQKPAETPAQEKLLTEIRDILKEK